MEITANSAERYVGQAGEWPRSADRLFEGETKSKTYPSSFANGNFVWKDRGSSVLSGPGGIRRRTCRLDCPVMKIGWTYQWTISIEEIFWGVALGISSSAYQLELNIDLGTQKGGWCYYSTGYVFHNDGLIKYGLFKCAAGDKVTFTLDLSKVRKGKRTGGTLVASVSNGKEFILFNDILGDCAAFGLNMNNDKGGFYPAASCVGGARISFVGFDSVEKKDAELAQLSQQIRESQKLLETKSKTTYPSSFNNRNFKNNNFVWKDQGSSIFSSPGGYNIRTCRLDCPIMKIGLTYQWTICIEKLDSWCVALGISSSSDQLDLNTVLAFQKGGWCYNSFGDVWQNDIFTNSGLPKYGTGDKVTFTLDLSKVRKGQRTGGTLSASVSNGKEFVLFYDVIGDCAAFGLNMNNDKDGFYPATSCGWDSCVSFVGFDSVEKKDTELVKLSSQQIRESQKLLGGETKSKTYPSSFIINGNNNNFVWKDLGSSVFSGAGGNGWHTCRLDCPIMKIGWTYQWTVRIEKLDGSVHLGISSSSYELDSNTFLGAQKGGWSYFSYGDVFHNCRETKRGLSKFYRGDKVTLTLDLSNIQEGQRTGGTLSASVSNEKEFVLFDNILGDCAAVDLNLNNDEDGFYPGITCFDYSRISFVGFNSVEKKDAEMATLSLLQLQESQKLLEGETKSKTYPSSFIINGFLYNTSSKFVWKDQGSSVFSGPGDVNGSRTCRLDCPVMEIGWTYQWTISIEKIFWGVALGISSSSYQLDLNKYLGDQKGGWGYYSKGYVEHNRRVTKDGLFKCAAGDKVTLTLDLSKVHQGQRTGGTLSAAIGGRLWNGKEFVLFDDILGDCAAAGLNLNNNEDGFYPAVTCSWGSRISFVGFDYVEKKDAELAKLLLQHIRESQNLLAKAKTYLSSLIINRNNENNFVWKDQGSSVFSAGNFIGLSCRTCRLDCPVMEIGWTYQWTIRVEKVDITVYLGISSSSYQFDLNECLKKQKGGWSYSSGGYVYHNDIRTKSGLSKFATGDEVILTLDLSEVRKGQRTGGTLIASVSNGKEFILFDDILRDCAAAGLNLNNDDVGFYPAASCWGVDCISFVGFDSVKGKVPNWPNYHCDIYENLKSYWEEKQNQELIRHLLVMVLIITLFGRVKDRQSFQVMVFILMIGALVVWIVQSNNRKWRIGQ